MPATKTTPTATKRSTLSAKAKTERDARAVDHVSQALEAAQGHLALIGGRLGTDARDLRKNVERLLRDARRDVKKMTSTLQRDIERLQKEPANTPRNGGRARVAGPSRSEIGAKSRASSNSRPKSR